MCVPFVMPRIIRHAWRRACMALVLALGLLMLGGCSSLRMGYSQADLLGSWWLDQQLDLNNSQTQATREALNQWLRWHRQNELPRYAEQLQRLQTLMAGPVQAEQVCALWDEAEGSVQRMWSVFAERAAPVVRSLTPRQMRHLRERRERSQAEWDKEWLAGSTAERVQRRLERTRERYADFYGRLDDSQTEWLRQQLLRSPWQPEQGRLDRLGNEQQWMTALQQAQGSASDEEGTRALLPLGQLWLSGRSAPAERQAWRESLCRQVAEFHQNASPEQRRRALRRLKAYEDDVRALMRSPG